MADRRGIMGEYLAKTDIGGKRRVNTEMQARAQEEKGERVHRRASM